MNAHQVITGALNNGENVYAIGNIEGLTFTACAVGSDVVILDSDFNRVQIIPESKNHLIVSSLSCCQETGKIAVTYGNLVKILEATNSGADKTKLKSLIFQFTWVETYSFTHKEPISSVQWSMEGLRLLFVIGNKLVLHQHRSVSNISRSSSTAPVTFCISDDDLQEKHTWEVIWTQSLPSKPKYLKYSPDGYYLAVAGDKDCFIKVFYQNGTEHSELDFCALTLNHPSPVCGFEWRKTGRYMPRKCIAPILMSWCEDRTSRLWKETPPPEGSIIDLTGEGGGDPLWDRQKPKKFLGKYIRVKKTKTKILNKIRKMMPEKHQETDSNPIGLRAQIGKSPSLLEFPTTKDATEQNDVSFYLAATINAETDCLLVPSFTDLNNQKPFCVHWLNNKELVFSVGAEKLLAEAVLLDLDSSANASGDVADHSPDGYRSDGENDRPTSNTSGRKGAGSVSSDSPSSKDILDVKLEILLRQWTKSNDVLFSIHPVDGSLLTWTVEWLDDHFRQPVISYSSRLPGALPTSDSMSLKSKLNTFNPHEPIYLDALRNDIENKDTSTMLHDKLMERRVTNTIHVLTSHDNGTLNLWHMSVDDQSSFSHVVSMTHISRMCGHRFQMQQIIAHPVLPLLLTTSKFKAPRLKVEPTMDVLSEVILWKITPVGPLCKNGGVKELARVASPIISGFSSVGWVPAILPSCTLGTVCNSPSSCFIACDGGQLVIYQAVLDARGLLSELSNAKTACNNRDTLDNYSDKILRTPSPRCDRAPSFLKQFNVVSTQSTAKPGCVLEVGKIEDVNLNELNLLFLHVFQARIVISDDDEASENNPMSSVIDRSQSPTFKDKFFIVLVDQKENEDIIMMFSLTISSQTPQSIPNFDTEALPGEKGFLRPSSPLAPSMAKLNFDAELVCRQVMPLPEGTRLSNVVPAAGHLSSSSIYPACETPYVLVSSDNDDSVRFWRCIKVTEPDSPNKYEWREWNMISENHPSELGVEGAIVKVNAAHSGRIACAYQKPSTTNESNISIEVAVFECESSGGVEWFREDSFSIQQNHFYEFNKPHNHYEPHNKRHSGTEQEHLNLLQQRTEVLRSSFRRGINAGKPTKPSFELIRAMENRSPTVMDIAQMRLENIVRLDWVSTEDGTHMLTVGMGTKVYIYAQIGQDPAQQNVTLMRESETTMRRPSIRKASSLLPNIQPHSRFTSWICCRVLNLDTADGLPPIPTALSWVRDGILIVGMQSEMRVYNQWNFKNTEEKANKAIPSANPNIVSLTVSTSHSMLDQLTRKKEALVSSRSRVFLEFVNTMHKTHPKENESQTVLDILKSEGVFETARMCSPILPQYHPKQLIVLLNAGKKRRVKAILNHVLTSLKQRKGAAHNPLSRAASIKRMSTVDRGSQDQATPADARINDDDSMDYDEIDDIPLLPLYALFEADFDTNVISEKPEELVAKNTDEYDDLFDNGYDKESDIDAILKDSDSVYSGRTRHLSGGSDTVRNESHVAATFSVKDYRKLTELLTHTHLPGLSSVDQMHLLAIADTLSHFASDAKDKVEQANAAMKPVVQSVLGDNAAGGYATAAAGTETVDECGLRYLMAMKQHEYLLVCLPMKQRMELKKSGLSAANIIWAQHSETETELLNALPAMHKTSPTWEELRGLGVAWWLKNTASLRICIEKIAKAAFQQNQDPMDASLFYLALRKKNVLTHLFKTVRNEAMANFFMNDFNQDYWQKVAAKNAFVLMSKQRFQHAAAFFLLSGSLKDAVQTLCNKCNDVQLALVVVRMYENDPEAQQAMLNELLCREVLGMTYEEFEQQRGKTDEDTPVSLHASKEPFERSMAFWMLKDYTRAAHTLVQEAQSDRLLTSLSDIFNFYSYLRKHPLVVRQRLNNIGAQVGTTEKLLAVGRQLECILTPPERRLFFRTSAEHMARGCPMLSLDVLTLLPKQISIVQDYDEALRSIFGSSADQAPPPPPPIEVDWSKPTTSDEQDELKLDWSDDEGEGSGDEETVKKEEEPVVESTPAMNGMLNSAMLQNQLIGSTDIFAQHMKFVASLRILTEELSTLASGFDVDGGQLRNQLLNWLEREVEVLQTNCDYNVERKPAGIHDDNHDSDYWSSTGPNYDQPSDKLSRSSPTLTPKRRTWLKANQKLLRSFTSFCTLHSAHNHRLASVLMELLLLLLNVQREADDDILPKQLMATGVNTFPLLDAAVSSPKMFVSSPLAYIENQGSDLLAAISELHDVPNMAGDLQKCYMLYNLSQGFACCIYLSLTDIDQVYSSMLNLAPRPAPLGGSENYVVTPPVKWPGVEALVALLGREKEDDAPQLRLLIIESLLAISMSLFCFALSAYDSRWLYRLSVHELDPNKFGLIFGGGGESKKSAHPPARPPRPAAPAVAKDSTASADNNGDHLRSRLNLRILGNDKLSTSSRESLPSEPQQSHSKWVPPQKNIVQFFAEKPYVVANDDDEAYYESDEEDKGNSYSDEEEENDTLGCENAMPSSFAWQLLRLALIQQQLHRVKQFLVLVGFDPRDIPTVAPRIDSILQQLNNWIVQQHQVLKTFPGGIPNDVLPDMTVDTSDQHLAATMKKYAALVKKGNTPFESDDRKIQSIRRLWTFLVREDHLQEIFIKYIFSQQSIMENAPEPVDAFLGIDNNPNLPEAYKIVQKDNEPIVAFGCNQESPGLIVVSNGRELQEMDMSNIFRDQYDQTSWMWNRADLDMKSIHNKRDALRDNDDYQIFTDSSSQTVKHTNVMIKRHIPGVRRIDSHPHAPFYVTGATDGSIKVWKWGAKDTVYTARVAGQHAKVSKIAFSCNGNKFAAVDGDGMLCLWQASQATEQRKPFFSQRCHNKSSSDVCFLGHSASVLLTAGSSSLDYNLGLWDTLLPTNRALVHSWIAHPEGATCALYVPNQQTIISGGRHGEICLWDIRQRQLRHTIKAFDQMHVVKTLATDSTQDLIVSGSSEGDIKIWSADSTPQLMYNLPGEHTAKGGFSFRQVGQSSVQGVQQLFVDQNMRLFSCGADASLKFRTLPSIFNMTSLL